MDSVAIQTVWLTGIAAVGTGFGLWITYQTKRIHTAVNSERTEMISEVKRLNEVITILTSHLSVLTSIYGASSKTMEKAVAAEVENVLKEPT